MKYRGREKEYHREYYQRRRKERIDYLGGKCVKCGSTSKLEFDHIDPSQKEYSISDNHFELDRIKGELDKCQLLCHKHHAEKTGKENSVRFTKTGDDIQHGIIATWMKRKCQCDVCLEARKQWNIKRNERRRKESKTSYSRGKYRSKEEQNGPYCKNGHEMNFTNKSILIRKNGSIEIRCKVCKREAARRYRNK